MATNKTTLFCSYGILKKQLELNPFFLLNNNVSLFLYENIFGRVF